MCDWVALLFFYLVAVIVCLVILGVFGLFGVCGEQVDGIVYSVLLGFFSFTILIWIVGFEPSKPRNVLL